jgi:SAM-dependent methyltransferase
MTNTSGDPRRDTWERAEYSTSASQSLLISELLCEAVNLRSSETVLDIACGSGVTSLAAARRKADVIGIDFSTTLLENARRFAAFENLSNVEFQEANAEDLPFDDETFDVVLSTFGAQFVEDQEAAANEIVRVCKRGGRIGLANGTPAPYFGHFIKLMADYAPKEMRKSPSPERSGVLWGTEQRLTELFGDHVEFLSIQERINRLRARSVDEFVSGTTGHLGPAVSILEQLDAEQGAAFIADLRALVERYNTVSGPDVLLESRYLEVVMRRR